MKKKVSVIVPIYNVEEYLENCINSICSQTYKNIEILLIDDGSTDGSGKLCDQLAELDARIKVFHHINKGVVAARGFGISCAEGEYISFIDGDDWIEPNMIEVLVERIGNADMISSGLYKYIALEQYVKRVDGYEDGTYEGIKYENFLKNMIYDMETHAFQRLTPWLCNKLFRKDLLQDAYEKLDEKIRYAEDAVCLYLYLLKCHSIVIIKDIFYHYLYRETSACHKVNDRMLIDINYGYLVLKDIFAEHKFGEILSYQLQKWVMKTSCFALNDHMGFYSDCNIPEFIINIPDLTKKRIVLYGAGRMGKDYKKQIEQLDCQIILWVDKNYELYREKGMEVAEPLKLLDEDYDVILIAIGKEETAIEIGDMLLGMGVEKSKILWRKPMQVF